MSIRKPAGHTSLFAPAWSKINFYGFISATYRGMMQGDRAGRPLGHTTGPEWACTRKPKKTPPGGGRSGRAHRAPDPGRRGSAAPCRRNGSTEKLGVAHAARRPVPLRAREIIHTSQGKGSFVAQISKVDAGPLMHLFNSQPRTLYDLLRCVRCWRPSPPGWPLRGTEADFIMIRRRYDEMMAAQGSETDAATHAHLDHAFTARSVRPAQSGAGAYAAIADRPAAGSVFACVNNLYHREPERNSSTGSMRAWYNAVIARQPSRPGAAAEHVDSDAPEPGGHRRKSSAWCARRGGWRAGLGRRVAGRAPARHCQAPDRCRLAVRRDAGCQRSFNTRCPGPGACRHRRGQSGSAAGSPARSSPARQNRAAARPASPGPAPRRCRRRSTAGWR